ncbi:multicopper oxidase-domain-containing protein [Collybia nuda]|uniref:Multicopper oxidase-domain-containing protein n=1 Tax=Collybia nuda TaxID=64659 RepID=A0A9P5XY32_9AGAR|nr:multicopper oxidase-domain-containing protein [Collybia nuda]
MTNFEKPVRRDTINIGGSESNIAIRFVADNTGPWFLHCHIDWHLAAYVNLFNQSTILFT